MLSVDNTRSHFPHLQQYAFTVALLLSASPDKACLIEPPL